MTTVATASPIDAFIERWAQSDGAKRANFQMFAIELSQLRTRRAARKPS